jgi:hypothetical protein
MVDLNFYFGHIYDRFVHKSHNHFGIRCCLTNFLTRFISLVDCLQKFMIDIIIMATCSYKQYLTYNT